MTARIITVSYSEIDAARQCPFKHKLLYIDRWTKPENAGGALDRGKLYHSVLEAHYRELQRQQMAGMPPHFDAAKTEGMAVLDRAADEGRDDDMVDLVSWMYAGYLDYWQLDANWEILAVEHNGTFPLFEENGNRSRFRLKVKIDLVIRNRTTGKVWVVDHKSHANLPNDKELDLDVQFPLYQASLARRGKKVFGTIYNTGRTQRNKVKPQPLEERFSRHYMSHSPGKLASIERDVLATAKSVYSARSTHERHPHPDTCRWRCDFTEPCLLGQSTHDDSRTYLMLAETGWQQDPARH